MIEMLQPQPTFRMMRAYEKLFAGKPELDILRAMGYFDRPAEYEAVRLVLPSMTPSQYVEAVKVLRDLRLLLDDDGSTLLDCHALIREHFAQWTTPDGHARLYVYYQQQATHRPDTLARPPAPWRPHRLR